MKKIIITTIIFITFTNSCFAWGINHSKFYDKGIIYTNSSFPQSTYNFDNVQDFDLNTLKKGESTSVNVLSLFDVGDSSIFEAAKSKNISKIMFVDYKIEKVSFPLGFIPFYLKQKKTIVYGE